MSLKIKKKERWILILIDFWRSNKMCETLANGKLVPIGARCVFCGRNPRPRERFGTGKKNWDAMGMICPDCWRDKLPPEPVD